MPLSLKSAVPNAGIEPSRRLPSHIPELDGIRAIAIWMVLVLHTFIPDAESSEALARWPKPLLLIMRHGWLDVGLFFVLSGFLITGILLESTGSPHYTRNFYSRRVLRILPVYFVCLVVMAPPGNFVESKNRLLGRQNYLVSPKNRRRPANGLSAASSVRFARINPVWTRSEIGLALA